MSPTAAGPSPIPAEDVVTVELGKSVRALIDAHLEHAIGPIGQLSPAESRVLRHLMMGHSPSDIAAMQIVSMPTVRTQINRILRKLDVTSQTAAVAFAFRAFLQAEHDQKLENENGLEPVTSLHALAS